MMDTLMDAKDEELALALENQEWVRATVAEDDITYTEEDIEISELEVFPLEAKDEAYEWEEWEERYYEEEWRIW